MLNLVHAIKVEFVPSEKLSGKLHLIGNQCRFKSSVSFTEIPIEGLVEVSQEKTVENNEKVFTTTARFETCRRDIDALRRVAFRLTSANGRKYMLGTFSRPYALIEETTPFPGKPSDTTLKNFKVTWKGPLPLLPIVE